MIKLSDFGLFDRPEPQAATRRSYQAARHSRQTRGWTTSPEGVNWILRCDLQTLRARAREMVKNSPHFRKFIMMAKANIVGHKGIQLQCDATIGKRPHTELNSRIETAFWQWGRREICTLSGKLDWLQVQQLFVETLIRDGEVLIEHIESENEFGYSLKLWNVDWLDETHNELLPGGNRVIMGVEVDVNERPVAYWLTEPASEKFYGHLPERRYRRRVRSKDIGHYFLISEDESQVRGVTWFHAALLQGKDFHEYQGGVVKSARVAAHTFGFLKQTAGEEIEFTGDDSGAELPPIEINKDPLSVNLIDPGLEFQQFDPKQPTQSHAEFANAMLHTLAAAMGVTGFSLAGDMSQVNFSSARVGLGEERELWKSLQIFMAETLCRDVYRRWLQSAWLSGRIEFEGRYYAQLLEPTWRPRGWSYIEPQKDIKAAVEAIQNNLLTYREHFAERGIDLEEWLEAKQKEKEQFAIYGIEYMPMAAKPKPAAAKPKPPAEEEERGYTNGKYAN